MESKPKQAEKSEALVMAKSVETFNLSNDVSDQELVEYQKQKRDFGHLSILTAGTVEYENAIQKVMDLLPAKSMIMEFNEKEKMRLAGDQVALKGLEENLVKKLKSHEDIMG